MHEVASRQGRNALQSLKRQKEASTQGPSAAPGTANLTEKAKNLKETTEAIQTQRRKEMEDTIAGTAVHEDLFGAKDAEVLRDVGLLHAELFDESPGGELVFAQEFQNGDTGWVAEGLEDVSLEATE